MPEDPVDFIALILIWVGLPLFMLSAFPGLYGLRNTTRTANKKRPKQLAAFERLLQVHAGPTLEIDWMLYRDMPKQHLRDLAAPWGWRYSGEEHGGKNWWLHFEYKPDVPHEEAAARLRSELEKAEVNAEGTYQFQGLPYGALTFDEFTRIIEASGWSARGSGIRDVVTLTKPGVSAASTVDELKLGGVVPNELRQNPHAVERGRAFQAEHGFDPLEPASLDWMRVRNKHWLKRCFPPGALCGGLLPLSLLPLLLGVSDEHGSETAINVGLGMLAAGALCGGVFGWLRYLRSKEIGPYLKVLREMRRIHSGS